MLSCQMCLTDTQNSFLQENITSSLLYCVCRNSVVSVVTSYGFDGPAIELAIPVTELS
jgi:hypothetical protein